MNITLIRDAVAGISEQYGVLTAADLVLQTIERPWCMDQPDKSCLPAATYALIPHVVQSGVLAGLRTWCLVNQAMGVFELPSDATQYRGSYPVRFACLIHPANVASQLLGCIAPGLSRGMLAIPGPPLSNAVLSSQIAFNNLKGELLLAAGNHTLTISWGHT